MVSMKGRPRLTSFSSLRSLDGRDDATRRKKNKWKGVFCVARALYDNEAESPDELAFRKGDCLTVLEQNTAGLQGWWLCSLRGRQGVCPANRLRLVPGLYDLPGRGITHLGPLTQMALNPNKVVIPQKVGESYLYDSPVANSAAVHPHYNNGVTNQDGSLEQLLDYDYPRPPVPCSQGSYDVPKSFRSSMDSSELSSYDVPRPSRSASMEDQLSYDVPKPHKNTLIRQEFYDIPRPHPNAVVSPEKQVCETYDVPKPRDPSFDVPQSHLTISDAQYDVPKAIPEALLRNHRVSMLSSGSSALSPSSSTSSLSLSSAEPTYDTPKSHPVRVGQCSPPEGMYDVPPQPLRDGGADRLSFGSCSSSRDSREMDMSALTAALPPVTVLQLELDSAVEMNEKLKEEVYSAARKLLSLSAAEKSSTECWNEELNESAIRMRDAVTEYCNFARGALKNASHASDSNLAQRMDRQLRPLLNACGIITKTVTAIDSGRETPLSLDQLLACTRHVPEDIRQVSSFIHGNASLLFHKCLPVYGKPEQVEGTTIIDDYDFVGYEPVEHVVNANDKQLLTYYIKQTEDQLLHINGVMDQFFLSVERNQPPRVFAEQGKLVVLAAHRLVYIGDTVCRNLTQSRLKSTVAKVADDLCTAVKRAVQATKDAALQFPSVQAVQHMVDTMVDVSNFSRELKIELSRLLC